MRYYGLNNKYYDLDLPPIKSGGEGAIHTIVGASDLLAKVYHAGKFSPELGEKIILMAKKPPSQAVLDQIAWPRDVLFDNNKQFVGFVMSKLSVDVELGEIYPYDPYATKKKANLTVQQKVIVAINICRVIEEIHSMGYVFGDFNPRNIGVNLSTGHVAFFDTDTYHIYDPKSSKTYRCNAGFPGYVAPELIKKVKGTTYAQAPLPTFTKETDLFALSIHIFKLMMNGYSPYNGILETQSSSQASPGVGDAAVERWNYCYKSGNKPQSAATLPLQAFPIGIQKLFKRSFEEGHLDPSKRPTASEWNAELTNYLSDLKACTKKPDHFYYCGLSACPYCEADQRHIMAQRQMSFGTSSGGINVPPAPPQPPRPPQPPTPPTTSGSNTSNSTGSNAPTTPPKKKKKGCGCLIAVLVFLLILGVAVINSWDYIADSLEDAGIIDNGGSNDNTCYYHSYGSWVVEKEATEERTGLRVKTCFDCGYRQEETIPKLDHTHNYSDWVVEKKATEESTGLRVQTCSKCGDRIEETIAKLDHVHIPASVPAVAATCSSLGKTEGSYCSKCNEVLTAQKDIPMDHSFANGACKYCGTTDKPSTGLTMQLNSDKKSYSVTGIGSCTDSKIVIPMTYEGLQVTNIGNQAFYKCDDFSAVVIPKSISNIDALAFYMCRRLSSITFGEGLKNIGGAAFYGCVSIMELEIPANVKVIADTFRNSSTDYEYRGVFEGCTSLTKVKIGDEKSSDSLTKIGSQAFEGCAALSELYIGNAVEIIGDNAFTSCTSLKKTTIGSKVSTINFGAFYMCTSLEELVIPDSVISIGEGAFASCRRLKSLTLGKGLTNIYGGAFYGCESLSELNIPANVKMINDAIRKDWTGYNYYGVFENCTALTKVTIGDASKDVNLTAIGSEAFQGCSALSEVYIGNAVGSIGMCAFNHTSISKLTVGNSVKTIGESAFNDCPNLKTLTLPDSVSDIGKLAFDLCVRLESVTCGSGLKTIGEGAFARCSSIKTFTFKNGVTHIYGGAFYGCASLTELTLPASVKIISDCARGEWTGYNYYGVFENCTSLSKVTIGNDSKDIDLTSIGKAAFRGCTDLIEVNIGNAVGYIGDNAFTSCSSLKKVTIGTSVVSINFGAFYMCTNLEELVIPDSVTSIGEGAFAGCKSLKSVNFGKGLTHIYGGAFYGCEGLTELVIPANVKMINDSIRKDWTGYNYYGVFENCKSLTKVTIGDSNTDIDLTTIGSDAFQFCTSLTEVYIGNSVGVIGDNAFGECTSLKKVTIGTKVKTINFCAFFKCSNLEKLVVPDSVTSIGEGAFAWCNSLKSVTLGKGLTHIYGAAFYGCSNLTELVIPSNVKMINDAIRKDWTGYNYYGVFENCTSLTKVTIGDSNKDIDLTTIGSEAFQGCKLLESVTIGRAVGSIGNNVFSDCTKLSDLYYLGSETEWNAVKQGNNWYSNTSITKVTYIQ